MPRKNSTWIKPRHWWVRNIACLVIAPIARLKYGVKVEKFREKPRRQYLILMNHQTAFDQFFLGMAFSQPVYYLASEDLFSLGFLSTLLRWAVAPIPIQKQTTDIQAIKTCIRVAREGGTIALSPEGNRTFAGRPVHMNASIAKLARKLGLPVVLFRIEGGYGIQPRWSDVTRKGKMRAYVSRIIEPEEIARLTDEALFEEIRSGLDVREDSVDGLFRHKKMAEYLERAIYVCPRCGLAVLHSTDDITVCQSCGVKVRHLPTKELEGVDGPFPFRFVADWYDYQYNYVNQMDTRLYRDVPMFEDTAALWEVFVNKSRLRLKKSCRVKLYGDRITLDGEEFPFDSLSAVTVLGKNKVNLYRGKQLFQLQGDAHFNGLKYVNLYHRHMNREKEDAACTFLGI